MRRSFVLLLGGFFFLIGHGTRAAAAIPAWCTSDPKLYQDVKDMLSGGPVTSHDVDDACARLYPTKDPNEQNSCNAMASFTDCGFYYDSVNRYYCEIPGKLPPSAPLVVGNGRWVCRGYCARSRPYFNPSFRTVKGLGRSKNEAWDNMDSACSLQCETPHMDCLGKLSKLYERCWFDSDLPPHCYFE